MTAGCGFSKLVPRGRAGEQTGRRRAPIGILGLLLSAVIVAPSAVWPQSTGEEFAANEVRRLNAEGSALHKAGKISEAEQAYIRAVATGETLLGPEHPLVATSLANLGELYGEQGRYAEAEPLFRRTLAIREKQLGSEDLWVAISLTDLAALYFRQGRYAEAEPLFRRAAAIEEKALGPEHWALGKNLNNLAVLYATQGRHAEAEPLFHRALTIGEKILGPEHPAVVQSLNGLASLARARGRFQPAEQLYRRALAIQEKSLGPQHPAVAQNLSNLAVLYMDQGRYAEAEPLLRRALVVWEKGLGPGHPYLAVGLMNLAALYQAQGRRVEAEPLLRRVLAIEEKTLGPEHPAIATSLSNLGELYRAYGEHAEAAALYRRALAVRERALGPEHPEVAMSLATLGLLAMDLDQYSEAQVLLQRATTILERALGPEHPLVAKALHNLAVSYRHQGQYPLAESVYGQALAVREKVLGPEHPDVAATLQSLAEVYVRQGRYAEAEPLFRRAAPILQSALGPAHPHVAVVLNNLALLLARQQRATEARALYQRAQHIYLTAGRSSIELEDDSRRGLLRDAANGLGLYAELLAAIARNPSLDPGGAPAPFEGFVVADHLRGGATQAALTRAGARSAAADPATAQLARQVDDLRNRRHAMQKQLAQEHGKPTTERDAARLASLQQAAQQADRELAEAVERLHRAFPRYAELTAPQPIDAASVQRLLQADEALVSYLTLEDRLLAWLVRPGRALVYRDTEVKRADLVRTTARVRASLDQSVNPDLALGQLAPFDVVGAHHLYTLLLAPFAADLAGVRHLLIVPDDVLLPLPFGVLVTRAEGEPYESLAELYGQKRSPATPELAAYAKLSWLAQEYAITVLPSATSLRALRQIARGKRTDREPFIGFGDPVLQGRGPYRGGAMLAARGIAVVGTGDVDQIRRMNRLPGTRDELLAVARALGADPGRALYLGARATEPTIMSLNASGRLGRARVLAFATHGLLAGELSGLAQPALVLTPPAQPTEQDDGLLSLDDTLKLRLPNTDWVILSACNTAADDGSGDGLTGLARAFFFAGARALLVSLWSVDDRATQALMTEVFRRVGQSSGLARAEAVRQGMLALMARAQGTTAYFAHPFAWAPFIVVGDGRN